MTARARHRRPAPLVMAALVALAAAGCNGPDSLPPALTVSGASSATAARAAKFDPAAAARATTRTPWRFAVYDGSAISSPHFRIYTTISSRRILERLPNFLEHALAHYTTALGDLPAPARRMETYVFVDRRQWKAKTRQLLPNDAGTFDNLGRGGFTTGGVSVLYYIDWNEGDRDTFAIAAHEGWHQYTQSTFRNPLPVWLEEGIATYMEGYRRPWRAAPQFQPRKNHERADALGDAIRYGRLIPLSELLGRPPQSFLEEGKDQLLTYYAQVWALAVFLDEGEGGRYRPALETVLGDAVKGRIARTLLRSPAVLSRGQRSVVLNSRAGPAVILAYFNRDLEAFERAYLEFARELAE